jgi:hypothetical protein
VGGALNPTIYRTIPVLGEIMDEYDSQVRDPDLHPPESVQKKPAVDRVTLGANESERVQAWINQLGEASKGFLELTKSDLINFLVRGHTKELAAKEIKVIRADNYDPIRHLNWITPRLKEALAKSDMAQVAILQDEIRSIELSVVSKASGQMPANGVLIEKPPRKKRKPISKIEEVEVAPA